MKKKIVCAFMCAAMAVGLLAGCGNSSESSDSANAGSSGESSGAGSVYWLNMKPEADAALQEIAATYTEQTGVNVQVVTAASGSYDSTLTAEMDKSNAPTLFVIGKDSAVKTWGSYAYDLKGTDVYNELTTDAFTLYDQDGKACSIAYCFESYGIIVNKTLLSQAGYSVEDITDFDSLKNIADDIHARADELGVDAFTSSGMDDSSSWRFTGNLANMPLYYESVDDGWTECPPEIKGTYLDNFKAVWDLYTTDTAYDRASLATGGYDAEGEFLQGKAVFYQNGSWEYSALSEVYSNDELAMIPIYCGVDGEENAGLCSGTENCWAVNAKASEADIQATLDFMYWMVTSEEGTACLAKEMGSIPYKGAAEVENIFLQTANDMLAAGKYNVDWTLIYTPNVDDWRATLVAAMNQYDNGGTWDNVEIAFVAGWANQYNAANAD